LRDNVPQIEAPNASSGERQKRENRGAKSAEWGGERRKHPQRDRGGRKGILSYFEGQRTPWYNWFSYTLFLRVHQILHIVAVTKTFGGQGTNLGEGTIAPLP